MCAYQFENNEGNFRPLDNQPNVALQTDAYFNRAPMQMYPTAPAENNGYRAMGYVPPQVMRQLQTGVPDFSAFFINPMQHQLQYNQSGFGGMFRPDVFSMPFNAQTCRCPHENFRAMPPNWQPRYQMERPYFNAPQRRDYPFPRHDIPRRDFPQRDFPQRDYPPTDFQNDRPHPRRRDRDRDRDIRDREMRPQQTEPPKNGDLRPQDVRRREGVIPQNERRALMELALRTAGVTVSEEMIKGLNTIIEKESGWKPNIVNNWDSNAKKGTPSKGLMQTIGPTFDSYKMQGYDDILNPLHNMIAGIRYANKRYGSLLNVPGLRSMRAGGPYKGY